MSTINIITLILSLGIVVGFILKIYLDIRKQKKLTEDTVFPPWPAKCPDYWMVKETGVDPLGNETVKCQNINKVGICKTLDSDNIMDFGEPPFSGDKKGPFYKCNWAKKCEAPWEGIDSLC
tara:strand:+ start:4163 stop:4525 length:363 start_codon:yes stop_codon:yes gene_type:complete